MVEAEKVIRIAAALRARAPVWSSPAAVRDDQSPTQTAIHNNKDERAALNA